MDVPVDVGAVEVTRKEDVRLALRVVMTRFSDFCSSFRSCAFVWHVEGPQVEVLQILKFDLYSLHLAVCD